MLFVNLCTLAALVAPAMSLAIGKSTAGVTVLDKREYQRIAAARMSLAKARAARKTKRSVAHDAIAERAIDESLARTGLSRRDFEAASLTKRQLPRMRCSAKAQGSDAAATAYCKSFYANNNIIYDSTATAGCFATGDDGVLDLCEIRCPGGTTTIGTDYSVSCIANVATCSSSRGLSVCPLDPHGITTCTAKGACQLTCVGRGWYKNPRNSRECINTSTQVENCGSLGHRCAASYHGAYPGACVNGQCTLKCPSGKSAYTVAHTQQLNCH